ncbi:MAG TPA: site-specific integrase [Rhizomicrobium sp.]|nr:site-specific integrase [Rhizomicrobium sp.]
MRRTKNPLRGLFKVKAKGKYYYYAWRGGPRIEAEFGTTEFLQEFIDARAPAHYDKSKMGAWVGLYRASDAYQTLSDNTKRNWAPLLDNIKAHFGNWPVRLFNRADIRQDIRRWLNRWRGKDRMADLAKQVLSRLCSFIAADGFLTTNPCLEIPSRYRNNRADKIWTEDDLDALKATASPEIYNAAMLAAFTGLRQGDLLRLTWGRIGDLAIDLKTSKSRGRRSALIPLYKGLRDVLKAIPKDATTVLTTTHKRPWRSGFRSSWEKAVTRAGLGDRELHFHDLRGTAATKFYAAGLAPREIADILGWSPERVEELLDRYVLRDELLRARILKIERHENENSKTASKTGDTK